MMNKRAKIATALGSTLVLAGVGASVAFASTTITSPTSVYTPVTPVRVLDTRTSSGAVAAHGSVTFSVTAPSGATGAALNVTVVSPTVGGDIVVDPSGVGGPTGTSNDNFAAGQTTANGVTSQLGSDGKVTVYNQSAGTLQLVVDLDGYYTPSAVTTPVVTFYEVNAEQNNTTGLSVSCNPGDLVVGGGGDLSSGEMRSSEPTTDPSASSWSVWASEATGINVYAICEHTAS